jgi:hypothetical protein
MTQLTDYEQKSLEAFEKSIIEGKWSNNGLVSMLKLITNDYLPSIIDFSKASNDFCS